MFIPNKYCRIYFSIIYSRISMNRKRGNVYYENHHIIPRSMGGDNSAQNLVLLTAKEHILAHRLLCKFTQGSMRTKALRAYHAMCYKTNGGQNKRLPTVLQLSKAREAASLANKGKRGIVGVPYWHSATSIEEFKSDLQDLIDKGMGDPEIGRRFGVSAASIHNWRSKLNLPKRRWQLRNREWLEQKYINEQLSAAEIGVVIGCSGTAIQQKLTEFKIPIRSSFDRQKLAAPKRTQTSLAMRSS